MFQLYEYCSVSSQTLELNPIACLVYRDMGIESHREKKRKRQKITPNSCKDKHRFKAVCVAGNIQQFYKVELNLSN